MNRTDVTMCIAAIVVVSAFSVACMAVSAWMHLAVESDILRRTPTAILTSLIIYFVLRRKP